MMQKEPSPAAWGMEFGGSAVRLVRLRRTGSAFRADRYAEAPLENRWQSAPDPAAASAALRGAIAGPVVVCLPDEIVLFRTLSLPAAGPEQLRRMVAGQLEALVPAQLDGFASGYRSWPNPGHSGRLHVLACAARREVLAQFGDLGRDARGAVPSVLALASLWAAHDRAGNGPAALLDVGARCSGLAVLGRSRQVHCDVIDEGGDQWTELLAERLRVSFDQAEQRKLAYSGDASGTERDPEVAGCLREATAAWALQLREAYDNCVRDVPRADRPRRCVLFGRGGRMPGLADLVSRTLQMEVHRAAPPDGLTLAPGVDFDRSATAIAAAMAAMGANWPVVDLAPRPEAAPRPKRRPLWRWAALCAWLVAAVMVLYSLDRIEAGRLDRAVLQVRRKAEEHGGLAQQLAVGRYLERCGPGPLDVLDRVSEVVPPGMILTTWRYSRDGQVTLAGTAPNEKLFLTMLAKLAEMGEVEWKSGRLDQNKFRFEVSLGLGPSIGGPATKPASRPGPKVIVAPSMTRPASAPASPRSGPAAPRAARGPKEHRP